MEREIKYSKLNLSCFGVLTAVLQEITFFWGVTYCRELHTFPLLDTEDKSMKILRNVEKQQHDVI